jgi:UPF0716 protein FxsA
VSYVLLFFAAVLAEVASLVIVGSWIGWWTLAAVAAAMALGLLVLSGRVLATGREAVTALAAGESPAPALVDGVLLAVAGLLLLSPGFASDVVGLALLLPPVRAPLRGRAVSAIRARFVRRGGGGRGGARDGIIDAEASEVEVGDRGDDPPERPTLSA